MGLGDRLKRAPRIDDTACDYGVISDGPFDRQRCTISVRLAGSRARRLVIRASFRTWGARAAYSFELDRETVVRLDAIIHDALEHQCWETPGKAIATETRGLWGRLRHVLWSEAWTGPVARDYGAIADRWPRGGLSVQLAGKGEMRLWLKESNMSFGPPLSLAASYRMIPLDRAAAEKLDAIAHDALRRWFV